MLALAGAALLAGGCGGGKKPTPEGLRLQRADLALVCRELQRARGETAREIAATKAAWPLVADGLPPHVSRALARPALSAVIATASHLELPALFAEATAASLTGQGSELAGLYRGYVVLASRSWRMIGAAIEQIEHGPPAAARFARANVNLYIEGVYDAHFALAQIGKKLTRAYKKLGGESDFAGALPQARVDALALAYSEPMIRLYPHVKAKLGS